MIATTDANDTDVLIAESPEAAAELKRAQDLAERYRCPFVDLTQQRIDAELVRSVSAELMFRYSFVPLEARLDAYHRNRGSQPIAAHR